MVIARPPPYLAKKNKHPTLREREIIMKTMYTYDVDLHFDSGWDTYTVCADCIDNSTYTAVSRAIAETGLSNANTIDFIRVYKAGTDKMYKEYRI